MLIDPRLYLWDVERLMDAGRSALESQQVGRVLRIARVLRYKHYSGGFELEARARWMERKHEEALAILSAGLQKAPQARALWEYLGEFNSNLGRYEEALDAFEKSKQCPNRTPATADYNIAIVYQRQGRHEEAHRLLETISDDPIFVPPSRALINIATLFSLIHLGRFKKQYPLPMKRCR